MSVLSAELVFCLAFYLAMTLLFSTFWPGTENYGTGSPGNLR
jgi:hypothetical protein